MVGAGPAGSTAARHLAAGGADVVLIDRHTFPREKVCGDGLIADAQRALDRSGLLSSVLEQGHQVDRATVFSPGRVEADVRGRFLTLPRRQLDQILLDDALSHGARLVTDKATRLEPADDAAKLNLAERGCLWARYVLVATGTSVSLLNRIGAVADPRPSAYAFRGYFRSERPLHRMVFSYDRSILPGYAWIFPVEDRVLNIGLGVHNGTAVRPWRTLEQFLQQFPLVREELGALSPISRLRGSSLRCGLRGIRPVTLGRVLAVGEAVGATLPFTGEGIGKAMETGEIAAEVVTRALADDDANPSEEYAARIAALRDKYVGYEVANRWLSRAWLADLVLSRIKRSPTLTRHVEDLIHERVDPRRIFSLSGLIRSLVD